MSSPLAGGRNAIEWPSLLLALVIYGGWLGLTWFHAAVPLWLLMPLGGWLVAWHSSLQHETIHGHPTSSAKINRLVGAPPLMLFVPYDSYRISHLMHHRDEFLTDPLDDPESHYWTPQDWAALSAPLRWLVVSQSTFLGRMLLGPLFVASRYLAQEYQRIAAGSRLHARIWRKHVLAVALVLAWVCGVCGMKVGVYLLAFVYPGTALILLRSFAEHRALDNVRERVAVVENTPVLGLLYLNNNLHAAHHEMPGLPWYAIPAWYKANRARLLRDNAGLVYDGYGDVIRRFFLTPHDQPVHPAGRVAQRPGGDIAPPPLRRA